MEIKQEWTIEFGCWFRGQKIESLRWFCGNILGEDSLGRFVLYYYSFFLAHSELVVTENRKKMSSIVKQNT